jgi:hypothetical protein
MKKSKYTKANELSKFSKKLLIKGQQAPIGYVWHPLDDEHMELVEKDIHNAFPHTGKAFKIKVKK